MICELLLASVMLHEGYSAQAYRDNEGILTIGYGTNLERWRVPERYAEAMVITDPCSECWMRMDLEDARTTLARNYPWTMSLAPARVDVLVEMVYNMGIRSVSRFRLMLHALYREDWLTAREEAIDSKWARQVGQRAHRLAKQLQTGEYWNAEEDCDATD